MEAAPLGAPPSTGLGKKTKDRKCPDGSGLNIVMCIMCSVCATAVVYTSWKESVMQNRLTVLENRVARLESTRNADNVDVLMERFRREAESQFRRRVSRGLRSDTAEEYIRTTRDVSECACPAGNKNANLDGSTQSVGFLYS